MLLLIGASFSLAQSSTVTVITKQAYIREEPSQESKVVATVKKGTTLTATAAQGHWYYVTKGKIRGWIHFTVIEKGGRLPDLTGLAIGGADGPVTEAENLPEWQHFAARGGTSYYYNTNRIVRSGKTVRVWTKEVTAMTDKKKTLYELDCGNFRYRILSIVEYDLSGDVSNSYDYDETFIYLVPDSIAESFYNIFCKR